MLCLAPIELVSDAERQLYRVLTALGSGSTVLGGLMVFVPVVDGAMQRRQADAVAFLPETVVVVRALAMGGRQSGELQPSAAGSWTVGGEILRLSGGGSNPAGQLARAAELVHATLESGGLDPGTPPALAVIEGSITSVRNRSAGGPVACSLDAGDVLTGLRHCANLGLQADRRVWTTADVKAALSIFGLQGRGPSVEELNNEGFLYSPYVLRRVQAGSRASAVGSTAASAGSAVAVASTQGPATGSGPVTRPRQLAPSAAPAPAEAALVPSGLPALEDRHAAVQTAPAEPPSSVPPSSVATPLPVRGEHTGDPASSDVGLVGLFDDNPTPTRQPRQSRGVASAPKGDARSTGRRRRTRPVLLVLAAALLVLAGVAGLLYVLGSGLDDGAGGANAEATSTSAPPAPSSSEGSTDPTTPPTQVIGEQTYALQAARSDTDCAANSFGQIAEYFVGTPCAGLNRGLFTTELDGGAVLVSVSVVQLADDATATEFRTLVDTNGTGNVDDLLSSGETYQGAPAEFPSGAYASDLAGVEVRIVEVGWLDEGAGGDDALLEATAEAALALDVTAT